MSSLHVGRDHVSAEQSPPQDGGVLDYSVKRNKTVEQSSPLAPQSKYPSAAPAEAVTGGWLQMNYTVVPYVARQRANKKGYPQAWLPLSVLRNAANLLTNVEIGTMRATTEESAFLNRGCAKVGLAFKFAKHTKLVTLEALLALHRDGNIILREISAEELAELTRPNVGNGEEQKPHQRERQQQPTAGREQQQQQQQQQQKQQRWRTPSKSPAVHRPAASGRASGKPVASLPRVQSGGHPARHNGTERTRNAAPTTKTGSHQQNGRNKHQTRPQDRDHSRAHSVVIQPARVCGKTISCLVKGDGRCYALLEALRRVFFPLANVKALQSAIENEAKLPTKTLTSVEEKAFIGFYKLPLKVLRCRLLVDIELVAPHLNALQMVLQSSSQSPLLKQSKVSVLPGPFPGRSTDDSVPAGSQNGLNKILPSGEQAANIKCQKAKKRSLEDMISKLKHAGP